MEKSEICVLFFFAFVACSESTSQSPQPKPSPAASKRSDNDFGPHLTAQAYTQLNSYKPQFQFANPAPPAGWYGFNHFVSGSRSARMMNQPFSTERRLRAATLLGETSQVFPMATFLHSPSVFEPSIVDLQPLGSARHYDPYTPPRIVMMDPALKVPRGVLIPVVRPPPPFAKRERSMNSYPTSRTSSLQTAANAPTPVTLKIIPLRLTSMDIANALKSMSWMPIPFNIVNKQNGGQEEPQTYNDKRQTMFDDDESDLPPPSSHVATPPLGITYAEGQKSERYVKRFPPRL